MTASVLPIHPDMLARIVPGFTATDPIIPRESFRPTDSGYRPAYRVGVPCTCPGCHRSHWLVGRLLAECAFCATALPIVEA